MSELLAGHRQAKDEIVNRLSQLADAAEAVGMQTLARDIRNARIPKIKNERFHLVVLGEFNHGKSTFVNALLGDDVLPTGITPTTAAINHVVYADQAYARATLADGGVQEVNAADLAQWVTVGGGREKDVAFVEVGHPTELLRNNITLVDTPGVNDLNEQRAEITYGYVPRADAVIFLLDAGQALKDSEREFLSSHVLEGSRDRMIFVLGKMDLLSSGEKTAVLDYVKKGLTRFVPEPVVFPLSARNWIAEKNPASGMPALLEYLSKYLETDRAQILLDNAAADAGRTAAYLERNLGVKLNACDLDLAELEERVIEVHKQLETSKRKLDEIHVRIKADAESFKAQVRLDLEGFIKAFVAAIPHEIDRVDADDVKTFLPSFLEDKFREWSEIEGAKIASLLEHLAEEVIAVTNENVAATSRALADRLGPSDTAVDIEVDSFKYDVGIYAVGALGTTVFLFVNTLAGGLLTLAAPVLAIVLKSKIAGDIREQAKERAPDAIRRAGEVMKPHFERCIDDFAKRLAEFVTTAGNTLYRGISEVLNQTVSERRSRASQLDALKGETSELIKKVAANRAALGQLREGIWDIE